MIVLIFVHDLSYYNNKEENVPKFSTAIPTGRKIQSLFAEYFGISVRTIHGWEQEQKSPPSYLIGLLKRILDLEYFNNSRKDVYNGNQR